MKLLKTSYNLGQSINGDALAPSHIDSDGVKGCSPLWGRCHYRLLSCIFVIVFLLTSTNFFFVQGAMSTNATLIRDQVNVRYNAGTNAPILATLAIGTKVLAGETVTLPNDPYIKWSAITFIQNNESLSGYVASDFLKLDEASGEESLESTQASDQTTTPVTSSDPRESSQVESSDQTASQFESKSPEQAPVVIDQNMAPAAAADDFEASLNAFPDSYKTALRTLHTKHPNWKFKAVNIAADWNTVVQEESKLGVSLIENSVNDGWKSTAAKAYNWLTNTYTPYDGNTWVNASSGIVAYYLDPRNLLSEPYIFQFLNLAYDAPTQTMAVSQTMLNNSFMASAKISNSANQKVSYAQTFMDAAAAAKASPYFLISRVIQEVGSNGSNSTSGTYTGLSGTDSSIKGYYNYFNIGAYSSADPVRLGLIFARYGSGNPATPMSPDKQATYLIPWNSPYRSIMGGSKYIAATYINVAQNTLYFQKFDVTDGGNGLYQHQYMTNIRAMSGESTTMYNGYSKSGILEVPLVFSIPVYSGMPGSAVPKPAETGNPNNWLKSLKVDGYALTPTFDPAKVEGYSIIVPYEISSIKLSAEAIASTSQIAGTGTINLSVGTNIVPVTVTAQNGDKRTYKITAIRNSSVDTELYKTTYSVNPDQTVSAIPPGTSLANLIKGFTLSQGAQIKIVDAAGKAITNNAQAIGTGMTIQILNGSGQLSGALTVVIYGDANGDGKISSSDLTIIARNILKQSKLSGTQLLASDSNHDGKVSSSDLTIIARHILKQTTIKQ